MSIIGCFKGGGELGRVEGGEDLRLEGRGGGGEQDKAERNSKGLYVDNELCRQGGDEGVHGKLQEKER